MKRVLCKQDFMLLDWK